MSGRLDGKVAMVTGAGQGIGRGVALALAKEGAAVAVVGRTEAKCAAVVDEIEALGGVAIAVKCDVTDRGQIDEAFSRTVDEFGRLDILVNNAQSTVQGLLENVSVDDVRVNWESGTLATLFMMQAALPHLKQGRDATVINFGSSTAIDGAPGFGAYAMAKEAIRGMSRVAANEWGRYGIRVNVVVPNALSPSAAEFRDQQPERFGRMLEGIPLGRVGDPEEDIGRAVVALASADLGYMTGETIMLTGGA